MKNITTTVDEDVAHRARVLAARRDTSVSRLLGDLFSQMMKQEECYQTAGRDYLSQKPERMNRQGKPYPSRDELHDRSLLR